MAVKSRRGLRLKQVEQKTGMRKTAILQAAERGEFPKPYKFLPSGRAIVWDEYEIDEFIEGRMADRA